MSRSAVSAAAMAVSLGVSLFVISCADRAGQDAGSDAPPAATGDTAPAPEAEPASTSLRFAVIGDYGTNDSHELHVAEMVQGWDSSVGLDFLLSVGDNNYNDTLDAATYIEYVCESAEGIFYGPFVQTPQDPEGSSCTATTNALYPAPGNHDWSNTVGYTAYTAFFPGAGSSDPNLYYDFAVPADGDPIVQLFSVNSNCPEADSGGSNENPDNHGCPKPGSGDCSDQYSTQKQQILEAMGQSSAAWNVVYFHHPPNSNAGNEQDCEAVKEALDFTSSEYRNALGYGLTAVISGHSHVYERIFMSDAPEMPFLIIGLSGKKTSCDSQPMPPGMASSLCYDDHHGALLVTASQEQMVVEFYQQEDSGAPVDTCVFTRDESGNQQADCTYNA